MADFVAVIRRAVDGLATNTPEARVRVYEKARGAVQRQLENMKPRPPEEMLRRQMDKLESAIAEVETEHSEALPSETAVPVAEAEAYEAPAPVVEETPVEPPASLEPEVPAPATEPVVAENERAPESYAAQDPYEQEAVTEQPRAEDEWRREPETVEPVHHEWNEPARTESVEPVVDEPRTDRYGDWRDEVPEENRPAFAQADEVERDEHLTSHEPVSSYETVSVLPDERTEGLDNQSYEPVQHSIDDDRREIDPAAEQASVLTWPDADHDQPEERAPEAAAAEQWDWSKSEPAPATDDGRSVAAAWDNVDDLGQTQSRDGVEAHFSPEMHASVDPVRMPAASNIPEPYEPAEGKKDEDPFETYVNAQPSAPAATAAKPDDRDPWSDLEDLIGYTKEAPATEPGNQQSKASEDDLSDLLAPPAKPYRVTPKRKRNYAGIILGLIGLLLLAGGGYALWINRDSLNDMVGGLIQFGTSEQTAEQAPVASTPTEPASPSQPAPNTPPAQSSTPPSGQPAPVTQAPPPADGSAAAGKFTQRLMQDGSETDTGPGDAGSLAQNAEGQSVSQLNAPPANPGPAAATDGAAGAAAAQTPPAPNAAPATPTATPSQAPAAAGERMFLYEERIGQSAPTAIEGNVSWSLQREEQPNGAPEPMVQGRITIPGRGLTALLTLKRNTDSSLPASHLIEIVFAVPPDFEGGAIDSVLRIAMKQTEQDRGNALVAVPAKITDDFHMIALNDFPDARATNMELLRTRDWIDIPVAYRNGRRALLTLQKGPDGKAAFDEAIREWSQQSGGQTGQ